MWWLLGWMSVAMAADPATIQSRLAEIDTVRSLRAADGVPTIPASAYADLADGEIHTGLVSVEGHKAKKAWGVGIMNAGPFCARLLTNAPLPEWHKEPEEVRVACKEAADLCAAQGVDIAQLAVQFCVANQDITTTVAGSANPDNVRNWAKWADTPMDAELLTEVRAILEPIKDIGHIEGLPENN